MTILKQHELKNTVRFSVHSASKDFGATGNIVLMFRHFTLLMNACSKDMRMSKLHSYKFKIFKQVNVIKPIL